jgi:hypothetical protein
MLSTANYTIQQYNSAANITMLSTTNYTLQQFNSAANITMLSTTNYTLQQYNSAANIIAQSSGMANGISAQTHMFLSKVICVAKFKTA